MRSQNHATSTISQEIFCKWYDFGLKGHRSSLELEFTAIGCEFELVYSFCSFSYRYTVYKTYNLSNQTIPQN